MGFRYFAYGSNIGPAGLAAKGVRASCSVPGRVQGWQLSFDVPSAFRRLEGGVANISQSAEAGDYVLGTVHLIDDESAPVLDVIEARGVLYERRPLEVEVDGAERVIAETYVGLDQVRDPALRPSIRYLKILIDGAVERGLAPTYIDHLRATETHQPPDITPFKLAGEGLRWLDAGGLAEYPGWVALYGIVFDVDRPRPAHAFIRELYGGKDATPNAVAMITGDPDREGPIDRELGAYLQAFQRELAEDYPIVARYASE